MTLNPGYPLDRLTRDYTSSAQTYTYDANGNRLKKGSTSYLYGTASNRLVKVGGTSYTLDAAGNTLTTGAWSHTYNNAGQLYQTRNGTTLKGTYTYNARGQRSHKQAGSATTVYHYDLQGRLIAETKSTGALIRAYVHADDQPVAQIDRSASDTLTYLHPDHLGTARLASDSQGRIVWRWEGRAFGDTAPVTDPDGDGKKTTINLRFPGQYADSESGLYYNWHRYYDPNTGRYITSDPIGLAGGLNTYTYAYSNPLTWIDPLGLRTAVVVNGPTAGNPIGHTAIAFPGTGIYSYGNNAYGMNLTDYVIRESPRRNSTVIIIETTPEQERRMMEYLEQFQNRSLQWWPDNCADRTSGALNASGMRNPYGIFPSSSWPDEVMAQAEFWRQVLGGEVVNIPRNSQVVPEVLQDFNRR